MPSVYSAFLHGPGQNVPWLVDTLMGSDIEWSLKMAARPGPSFRAQHQIRLHALPILQACTTNVSRV